MSVAADVCQSNPPIEGYKTGHSAMMLAYWEDCTHILLIQRDGRWTGGRIDNTPAAPDKWFPKTAVVLNPNKMGSFVGDEICEFGLGSVFLASNARYLESDNISENATDQYNPKLDALLHVTTTTDRITYFATLAVPEFPNLIQGRVLIYRDLHTAKIPNFIELSQQEFVRRFGEAALTQAPNAELLDALWLSRKNP